MSNFFRHEKKLEESGTRFAGQRGMSIDEASKILIPKKYMEGHAETLMQFVRCTGSNGT